MDISTMGESSSSMDHTNGGCKSMMYWNWYSIDACFFSQTWQITSVGMFAGLCIGIMCLAIILEFLRRVQRELQHSNLVADDYNQDGKTEKDAQLNRVKETGEEKGQAHSQHIQRAHDECREDEHDQQPRHHQEQCKRHQEQRLPPKEMIPRQHPRPIDIGQPHNISCRSSFEEMASTSGDAFAMVPPSTPLLTAPSARPSRRDEHRSRVWPRMPNKVTLHIASTAIYTCEFAIAYLLMLMAMYYNGFIIICIFLGAFLGRLIWGWDLVSNDSGDGRH